VFDYLILLNHHMVESIDNSIGIEFNYEEEIIVRKKVGVYIAFTALILAAILFAFRNRISSEKTKIIKIPLKQGTAAEEVGTYTIDQLTKAVLENNINLVNRIIDSKSVDINGKDSEDKYPIEIVLVMNNCDMAKILLGAGADPYVITADGESVYAIVMKGDSNYLKEIFIKYGK